MKNPELVIKIKCQYCNREFQPITPAQIYHSECKQLFKKERLQAKRVKRWIAG
jgi:hypothetical protein